MNGRLQIVTAATFHSVMRMTDLADTRFCQTFHATGIHNVQLMIPYVIN